MLQHTLPPPDEMFAAVSASDTSYDGIFFTAVKTTRIFCRPSCTARTPLRKNVTFYPTAHACMTHGFRPCKRCRPLERPGEMPDGIQQLLRDFEADPATKIRDQDLRNRGLEPASVRRWFKKHHGITFQAYQRARRLSKAIGEMANGSNITQAAYENGYESLSGFQEAMKHITGRSAGQSKDAQMVYLSRVLTPLGPMILGATEQGVCLLEFTDRRMLETQLKRLTKRLDCVFVPGSNAVSEQMERELEAYFEGERQTFETPLLMAGTDFQERVWQALQTIPFGQTRSYGEQARILGDPKAVRAVARANGDNRIAIVIPCHRVIGADGSLTGYGGGLWRKRYLLELEQKAAGFGSLFPLDS